MPKGAFDNLTETEQPIFMGTLKKGQKARRDPLAEYEGSISHAYFVEKDMMRKFGDIDLHSDTFSQGVTQIKRIEKGVKADDGRKFVTKINEEQKSVKMYSEVAKRNWGKNITRRI